MLKGREDGPRGHYQLLVSKASAEKFSGEWGATEKTQDRKIAPLSLTSTSSASLYFIRGMPLLPTTMVRVLLIQLVTIPSIPFRQRLRFFFVAAKQS